MINTSLIRQINQFRRNAISYRLHTDKVYRERKFTYLTISRQIELTDILYVSVSPMTIELILFGPNHLIELFSKAQIEMNNKEKDILKPLISKIKSSFK